MDYKRPKQSAVSAAATAAAAAAAAVVVIVNPLSVCPRHVVNVQPNGKCVRMPHLFSYRKARW